MNLNLTIIWVFIAVATATLGNQESQSEILEETNTNDGSGNYRFRFKTSNGIFRTETGQLTTDSDSSQKYIVVRGSYSYIDTDGNTVVVHYIADENGYVTVKPDAAIPVAISGVPGPVLASLLG